jgi:hypothetical protein
MPNPLQESEGSMMHKSWLEGHMVKRGGAKFVTVGWATGDLFQNKVFMEAQPIKSGIGQGGYNLWNPKRTGMERNC